MLDIVPIHNEVGKVVLFLLSYKDITDMYTPSRNASIYSLENTKMDIDMEFDMDTEQVFNVSRRRSRAVLTELSGRYIQNKNGNMKSWKETYPSYFSSHALPLYKSTTLEGSCLILHYGTFRKAWDCIILAAIVYVALIVPYNAAFNRNMSETCDSTTLKPSISSDIFIEMIFILDILFNFRMTFVNIKGEVVYSRKEIALNYLSGWFILDLLAALPFDLLYATCLVRNMVRGETEFWFSFWLSLKILPNIKYLTSRF